MKRSAVVSENQHYTADGMLSTA